MLHLLDR